MITTMRTCPSTNLTADWSLRGVLTYGDGHIYTSDMLHLTIRVTHTLGPTDWCSAGIPALDKSFRLRLDTSWPPPNAGPAAPIPAGWSWTIETMPVRRNQGASVLLPNGMVLLLSGGQVGVLGRLCGGRAALSQSLCSKAAYGGVSGFVAYRDICVRVLPTCKPTITRLVSDIHRLRELCMTYDPHHPSRSMARPAEDCWATAALAWELSMRCCTTRLIRRASATPASAPPRLSDSTTTQRCCCPAVMCWLPAASKVR